MHTTTDSYLKNTFTPPNYLDLQGVGLNISDHSIKMMEMASEDGNYKPIRHDKVSIPESAVVEGDIKDRESVSGVLKKLRNKHNFSYARLSIPEENGYIFNLEIPPIEEANLRDTIKLRLDEKIPIDSQSTVFDYEVTRKKEDGTRYVTVSALPQGIVGEYMEICREADLKPLSFEIEAQTIARAVVSDEESAVMIIDIGKSRTGIFIANAGTVEYTTTIQIGGDHLTEAVAEATDRSIPEAEEYKQEHGFVRNNKTKKEYEALEKAASDFVEESVRRFRYWYSNPSETVRRSREISEVVLVGGNASVPGLDDHISSELDVSVTVGDVWKKAFDVNEYIPEIDFRHSLTYTSAIGLALSNEY
jgi:type IV pilus assembly protein PilM